MNGTQMDNTTTSRWISLLLAVDHIDDYCESSGIPFSDDMLKPIAIKHFIQEKADVVKNDLDRESDIMVETGVNCT